MPKEPDHYDLAAVTAARIMGKKTVPRFIVMKTGRRRQKHIDSVQFWVVETNGLQKPYCFNPGLRCFVRKVRNFGYAPDTWASETRRAAQALADRLNYEHENGLPLSA